MSLFILFSLFFVFFVRWYYCNQWSGVNKKIFSVPLIFYCHGKVVFLVGEVFWFGYYVYRTVGITHFGCFWLASFFNFLLPSVFKSANFRKMAFFFLLWHVDCRGWYFWLGFQFGALQDMQFLSFGLSSVLFLCFSVSVLLCKGSSLFSFSRFDTSASGIVFFLFLPWHVSR